MIDFGIIENFILPSLFIKKEFSIWKKVDAYKLIIIDRNLLLSKNKKVNKKTKQILVRT